MSYHFLVGRLRRHNPGYRVVVERVETMSRHSAGIHGVGRKLLGVITESQNVTKYLEVKK